MQRIATRARPPFVLALLVMGVMTSSLLVCDPPTQVATSALAIAAPEVIELAPGDWQRAPELKTFPHHPAVITPPEHPDARPWPLGMVIGTPPTKGMLVVPGSTDPVLSVVDKVLSALFGPNAAAAT